MNFKPCTEQEIAEMKLWPKGEYPFEILNALEKASKKSGKPMIELRLKLSNGKGQAKSIKDYLMPQMPEKLRHAAIVCGLLDKYLSGSLSDVDFVGRTGRLRLGVEKDKGGQYPPKNVVLDYVC
jgi:hypothetical protein